MKGFSGKRIFVLEDEPIIAMSLEDMLEALGCELAACAANMEEGRRQAADVACDAAILDININGERSDAIAAILRGRRIPYVFATGYGAIGVPRGHTGPVLEKPYDINAVEAALDALFGLS